VSKAVVPSDDPW